MKKLLIAMTAAAVGTCAWADGEQTLLNETFTGWSLTGNTWWSYSADAAEGELTVTNTAAENAEAEYKLALNTGSKVLTGSFTSDDQPKAIGTDGLYFNATVTFKDPSDTLPELKDSDKFALVVLDNVESIDAGKATTPATNLWVIAKYGENAQRAYQLDVEVTPSWLAEEHKIVVKAYNNVMANGNCAGFLVKVDNENNDTVCEVVQSCAIVEGVIDFNSACAGNFWKDGEALNLGYLGYPKEAILGAIQKRYTDATLILSNVPGSGTLASVDFQGQGVIDNVSLATSGADFGTDSLALTVVADGVTLVDTDTTLYFAEVGDEVTIKFRVNEGYELSSPTGLTPVDGVYTYVYTTTANNEKVTISAFEPKVSVVVGDETKKFGSLAEALESESVAAGSELKLTAGYTVTEAIAIAKNITINLNGQKLSATLTEALESMFELAGGVTLTITDTEGGVLEVISDGDRTIAIALAGGTTVAINKGTIDAAAVADALLTYNITGGKFLKEANDSITVDTNKYVVDADTEADYYIVKDKPAAPTTFAVTYEAGNFTITKDDAAFASGTELANGTYNTFKVAAAEGYDIVSVTVGGNAVNLENGAFSVTVNGAAVAIVVITREVKYPESEGLVTGDVTAEVAGALDDLATALGGDVAVTNYITQVCGGTVDAATLTAAKTAGTIGLSVDYDLPLMAAEPTVSEIEAEAATTDDAAAFSFQLKVGNDPVEIKKVTDKVRKMIQYGTTLSGMAELTAQDTGVALEVDATSKKIKVKLLKTGGNAGFMKVKLNK